MTQVRLKFKSRSPLTATHHSVDDNSPPPQEEEERRLEVAQERVSGQDTEPVTAEQGVTGSSQEGDAVLEGKPLAYITIGG